MKNKVDTETNKFRTFLKVVGIIILILILIIAGAGTGGYIYLRTSLGKMKQVEINEDEIEINEGVKEQLEGYRTIALFGVDSRSNQLETGTRSDCIILAAIDQKTKAVKLVSIYRDTFLKIPGRNLDKTTHAYAFGGAQLALSTLNSNLDLNITEFATVNFESIIDIVEAVNGVEMTVEKDEVKHLNNYVNDMHKEIGTPNDTISGAGKQTLSGVQALAYARIRYTAGGDSKRTERMRDVLMAVVEKAKKMNIGQLNSLVNKVLPEIYTNISPDEIIGLLPQIATYSFEDSIGWPYNTRGSQSVAGRGNTWYGIPVTLESNVKQLHKEVYGKEDYTVSNNVKTISDSIIKATGYSK